MQNPTTASRVCRAAALQAGARVRVNHYEGCVRRVITHLAARDPLTGGTSRIALTNPLYDVELDYSRKGPWARRARQVYLPPGETRLKLFRDEFEPLGAA